MSPLAQTLVAAVGQHLRGKDAAVELAVIALFAGGHVLVEDHPGVGKTLLAKALAKSLDLPFQRVQCTADLLPSDIVGAQVYQPRTGGCDSCIILKTGCTVGGLEPGTYTIRSGSESLTVTLPSPDPVDLDPVCAGKT